MKKFIFILIFAMTALYANSNMNQAKKDFRAVSIDDATILQKGDTKNFCPICGMTLPSFFKTNHAATHDGHTKQYCSVHCMVEDKEINGKKTSNEKVVDNSTLKFIDVKSAYYIVGSNKAGTMSAISKYAFSKKEDALAFQKENGGELKSYDEVYAMVSKGIKAEKAMITKRQAKVAKMGEKVYAKMCKKTDLKFSSTAEAKAYVIKNNLCGNLKGKKLQAVGIYLGKR